MTDAGHSAGDSETEVKLEASHAMLAALRTNPALAAPGRTIRLHACYYDTADGRLSAAGAALRVRTSDRGHEQTFKVPGPAGSGLRRHEWSVSLPDGTLAPGVLPDAARARLDALTAGAPLLLRFTVDVMRELRLLTLDDAEIEVAFDEGRVAASGRESLFCELELECRAGAPAALFRLARALPLGPGLHWSLTTKAARGHALLADGAEGRASGNRSVPLDAAMTAGDAFAAIVWHCLAQFLAQYRLAVERDTEALHQTRIALRRLRTAFSVFKPLMDQDMADVLRAEFRAVAAATGPARDLDVLIRHVARADDSILPRDLRDELLPYLRRRRRDAYGRAVAVLDGPALQHLLFDTMLWLETGDWRHSAPAREPVLAFVARILPRRRRKLAKAAGHLAKMTPAARHRLRIAGKKLRYTIEALDSLFTKTAQRARMGELTEALAQVQSALGTLNDMENVRNAPLLGSSRIEPIRRARLSAALTHVLTAHDARDVTLLARAEQALQTIAAVRRFWPKEADQARSPSPVTDG